ncbi:alpha/beta fold hydrolase [Sorangium sp. So ce426]|uniref:alpha/beta fold hydrolase n=1 Tax=Sorangium sp. So ce426 TaxID=3133312 RepID=UPI003F5C5988
MTDKKQGAPSSSSTRTRRQVLKQAVGLGAGLAATSLLGGEASAAPRIRSGTFMTSDGVALNYLEAGRGRPLLLLHGWSQSAALYRAQILAFSRHHHVFALDWRGHGASEKPEHGYRMARFSRDLHEFISGMRFKHLSVLGHSMGCGALYGYWDNYGGRALDRLILVDVGPAMTAWPDWSPEEAVEAGALFTPQSLHETAAALRGPDGIATTYGLVATMFTAGYPADQLALVVEQNLKLPREYAAKLLVDQAEQDWRDVIPRIDVPTLVVGGEASIFNPISQQWVADQIPGAELILFGADEGGSHFMWLENPEKFNEDVLDFLG